MLACNFVQLVQRLLSFTQLDVVHSFWSLGEKPLKHLSVLIHYFLGMILSLVVLDSHQICAHLDLQTIFFYVSHDAVILADVMEVKHLEAARRH